jgi:hypothetical protein
MPSLARTLTLDHPLYSKAELIEHRRNTLRYARSFPPGSERRQITLSLRALFKSKKWLGAYTGCSVGTDIHLCRRLAR